MKKRFLIIFVSVAFISCGGGNKEEKKISGETDITKNPDYQKGLALVAKNQCFTCHNVEEAVTGPAYRDVAKKYAGMPDTIVAHLAQKIITGGNGVWGEIFMTPHPGISEEDAETMVKYILLLNK